MDNIMTDLKHTEELICNEVKKQLISNPLLNGEDLLVSAEGDTIVLGGVVGSLDEKLLAEDIARETFGVLNVRNGIHISGSFEEEPREGFYEDY